VPLGGLRVPQSVDLFGVVDDEVQVLSNGGDLVRHHDVTTPLRHGHAAVLEDDDRAALSESLEGLVVAEVAAVRVLLRNPELKAATRVFERFELMGACAERSAPVSVSRSTTGRSRDSCPSTRHHDVARVHGVGTNERLVHRRIPLAVVRPATCTRPHRVADSSRATTIFTGGAAPVGDA